MRPMTHRQQSAAEFHKPDFRKPETRKPEARKDEYYDTVQSLIGTLFPVFRSGALTAISFTRPSGIHMKKTRLSELVKKELSEYFGKKRTEFSCPLAFESGTEFEQNVWNALREVPYGETRTYKWIAEKVGRPQAFRAVGGALGKNPIPIILPCHRIIESDGSLGGYSGGIDIKRRLLDLEYYVKFQDNS